MRLMSWVFILAMSPLSGQSRHVSVPTEVLWLQSEEQSIYDFATFLEKEGDYYRAITEYKRIIFLALEPSMQRKAWRGIARCYHAGRKWEALALACQQALSQEGWTTQERAELNVALALALWNRGLSHQAHEVMKTLPQDFLTMDVRQLQAWLALAVGELETAKNSFAESNMPLAVDQIQAGLPARKSPVTAGFLSAVLPGAGQLYTDHPKAAIGAFLVNGLFVAATAQAFREDQEALGWGLGIVGLGFWTGNVYGAVNFAVQNNRELDTALDDWLARKIGLNQDFKANFSWKFTIPF